jgi:hypothetical protein
MLKNSPFWFKIGALCLVIQLESSSTGWPADAFNWQTNTASVSADIRDGKLSWLLEEITSATGWQVFVEPGLTHVVSAKFEKQPPGKALRLLLGDLNFALIPLTNSTFKLFVFRTAMGSATQQVTPAETNRIQTPANGSGGRPRPRNSSERPGGQVPKGP